MGITWDSEKNARLRGTGGIDFDDLLKTVILGIIQHPGRRHQKLLLFEVEGYVWAAPCVIRGDELFLKTAFPSRKYTKLWRLGDLP